MPLCKGCFCWRDLKVATTAVVVLSLVTSLVQILVETAVFTGSVENVSGSPTNIFNKTSGSNFSDQQVVYILYIVLAGMDLINVLLSLTLLFGVDLDKANKCYFLPWICFMPIYLLYESAINIYFFYKAFSARSNGGVFIARSYGYLIVPIVYWIIKDVLILCGWFVVISRVQQLRKYRKSKTEAAPLTSDFNRVTATTTETVSARPFTVPPPDEAAYGHGFNGFTPAYGVNRVPVSVYTAQPPAHYQGDVCSNRRPLPIPTAYSNRPIQQSGICINPYRF